MTSCCSTTVQSHSRCAWIKLCLNGEAIADFRSVHSTNSVTAVWKLKVSTSKLQLTDGIRFCHLRLFLFKGNNICRGWSKKWAIGHWVEKMPDVIEGSVATPFTCGGISVLTLLQIYCGVIRWKKFENGQHFAELNKSVVEPFSNHSVQFNCGFLGNHWCCTVIYWYWIFRQLVFICKMTHLPILSHTCLFGNKWPFYDSRKHSSIVAHH